MLPLNKIKAGFFNVSVRSVVSLIHRGPEVNEWVRAGKGRRPSGGSCRSFEPAQNFW